MTFMCGSRDFMAPEVLACSYTSKADLWSVGVISYTMLCGILPWKDTEVDIWKDIRAGEPYYHPETFFALAPGAQALVRALLTCDASCRPSAAKALQDAWIGAFRAPCPAPSAALVGNIREFVCAPPVQRAARAVAASQLTGREADLRSQFDAFGAAGTGTIRLPEFKAAMTQMAVGSAESSAIFDKLGPDARGEIEFNKFATAAADRALFDGDVCRLAFERLDTDCDGQVTASDFRRMGFKGAIIGSQALSLNEFSLHLTQPAATSAEVSYGVPLHTMPSTTCCTLSMLRYLFGLLIPYASTHGKK